MRLRKYEELKLQDVLDREYETPREAATVVFNTVVELLAQRKSFAVGVKFRATDTITLIFGPFWDLGSANRFAAAMARMGLLATRAHVYRPETPQVEPEPSPWCHECGHPEHLLASGKRGICLRKGCNICGTRQRRKAS